MKAVLDTSILIDRQAVAPEIDAAISVVSVAELHFGLLVARGDEQRASRAARLGVIEARFPEPLAIDDLVAREWGHLQATVARSGGQPRRRASDLAIAATARVHDAVLMTHDVRDFSAVAHLVDIRGADGLPAR